MATGRTIKKFNPLEMSTADVLALATGREQLLTTMMKELKTCASSDHSQHYILFGPRGIGKSFFLRYLKINHDQSDQLTSTLFLQLPEELDNINYVADIMDIISTKLEGGYLAEVKPKWEMNDHAWSQSNTRLKKALKHSKTNQGITHVFVTLENLQDFIPRLDNIENARMRQLMSEFHQISIIGSSLRPDLDTDYNKMLFQVFKKSDVEPWTEESYLTFYNRKANIAINRTAQLASLNVSKHKIKAISAFTGGSPRLAVILSSLILDQNILQTADLLEGILDDLTAYYQDLTRDIPAKSKALFDMLIRKGENITQSNLAQAFDPPLEDQTSKKS